MGEFLQGVYDDFKSRIESPLLFSIFVSWALWNSDFVWFLLFGENLGKYYKIIGWNFNFCKFWIYPTITAAVLILIVPVANNFLMLCRYKLLSSFQHKVQESKGIYTAALELVVLKRKTEELDLRFELLSEKEAAYTEAKVKFDSDKIQFEKESESQYKLRKSTREFKTWPIEKAAYESKVSRLTSHLNGGDVDEVHHSTVEFGSYVVLNFKPLDVNKIDDKFTLHGFLDEIILSREIPIELASALVGKGIGDGLNCDYRSSPNEEEERYSIEVVQISSKPGMSF